jgi:hypothetical protein
VTPIGVDADEDGLDDGCDPCPDNADCDADGFCDGIELYLGTDPLDACPDDPSHDAWPPDTNIDTWASSVDILFFAPHTPSQAGDLNYDRRFDLNTDGWVSSLDILTLVPFLGTQCGESVGALAGTTWCWACIDFPVNSRTRHVWGEFRWTIPTPFGDIYRTKYRMDLWATFMWLNFAGVYVTGVGNVESTAEAEPLYYIAADHPLIQIDQESPDVATVTAETIVEFAPGVATLPVQYAITLWIEFLAPNVFTYDGSGFHHYWID